MRILNISVVLLVYSNQATIKAHQLQSTEFCDEAPFHHPSVSCCEHHHLLPADLYNCRFSHHSLTLQP